MWRLSFAVLVACGGGGQSPGPDANPNLDDGGNIVCVDDGPFEPNDMPGNAFPTGVGPRLTQFSVRASLCPEPDIDLYQFEVTAELRDVDARLTLDDGGFVELSILTTSGEAISTAETLGSREAGVVFSNAPIGPLLVGVSGNGRHNYQLVFGVKPGA